MKNAPIPLVALENSEPSPYALERMGPFTQCVQPYHFGCMETKGAYLWLKGFPPLEETNNVYEEMKKLPPRLRAKVHYASPGKNRSKFRSRFNPAIAETLADQWGHLLGAVC